MFSWSLLRVLLFQESQHPIGSDNSVVEENASPSANKPETRMFCVSQDSGPLKLG